MLSDRKGVLVAGALDYVSDVVGGHVVVDLGPLGGVRTLIGAVRARPTHVRILPRGPP